MNINLLNTYNKYWPSLFATAVLGITYYFTPKWKSEKSIPTATKITNICTDEDEWNFECEHIEYKQATQPTDYWGYINHIPLGVAQIFFVTTVISNLAFGRRPDNDWKHNPPYHIFMENAGKIIPGTLAILTQAGTSIATTIFGERAKATNHIASVAVSALGTAINIAEINSIKEDHKADRTIIYDIPSENSYVIINDQGTFYSKGEMLYTEFLAMKAENFIIDGVFTISNSIFIAAEFGITKFIKITDENRNSLQAIKVIGARFIDDALVSIVNEYAFYAEKWANLLRINNPIVIVKLEKPLFVQAAAVISSAAENIGNAAENMIEDIERIAENSAIGIKHAANTISNFFKKHFYHKNKNDIPDNESVMTESTGGHSGFSIKSIFHTPNFLKGMSCHSKHATDNVYDPSLAHSEHIVGETIAAHETE